MSNCIHAYDQQNCIERLESSIDRLSTLPPKLRSKPTEKQGIISQCYTGIQVLLEQFSDLHGLSTDVRRTLTERNMSTIGALHGIYLCGRFSPQHHTNFVNAYAAFYGWKFAKNCIRLVRRCDFDGNPFKVILVVLLFSENCSIVRLQHQQTTQMEHHSISLTSIQNIYVTVLWKYLVFLHGFDRAVLRLTSFIKLVLDTVRVLDVGLPNINRHEHIIDHFIFENPSKTPSSVLKE